MKTQKEAYINGILRDIEEISATIDELEARASRTLAGADPGFEEDVRILKERRDRLSNKVQEYRASADEAWIDLKTGVETAKSDLAQAFAAVREKFREAA